MRGYGKDKLLSTFALYQSTYADLDDLDTTPNVSMARDPKLRINTVAEQVW